jgi:hypothetical protein
VASVVALCGFLLYRLQPDITGKPYYEDEAITGLIAMRPLGEVLETVLVDRGGAPLHFLLAYAAFWVEASADTLRWLSVLAALAAVPLCFDLARRLGGLGAGVVAAAVAASSTALAVYGSFGRMYALFVFVAALFSDLFVRALQVRTGRAVAAAAAAGWLLVAVHPYGAVPAFVALAAAAVIWRGRGLRTALPVAIATLAAVPFLAADFRLADRSGVGSEGERLASPGEAWGQLIGALSAFAGGDELPLLFSTALGLVGLVVLVRREAAVAALAVSTAIPPLLFVFVRTDTAPDLSPRHLFYGLPLWAAAIGIGASTLARSSPVVVALIGLIAVVSPASALRDPREFGFGSASPDEATAIHAGADDLLLPYSSVFLVALPDVRGALALPHGPGDEILRALEHTDEPVDAVYLAVPTTPWTVRRLDGPFDKSGALSAAAETVREYEDTPELRDWLAWIEPGLCEALRELDRACP